MAARQLKVSPKAEELYDRCIQESDSTIFNQADLSALSVATDATELLEICKDLVANQLFHLFTLEGVVCYKVRSKDAAKRLSGLDPKEVIVYTNIEAAGTTGIWTKTLKARTNLHDSVLTKCLKALEGRHYIKAIKSIKHPGRKIYMLYDLVPGEDVTGGPWFSDGELDVDFIDLIGEIIIRIVKQESWREGPKVPSKIREAPGAPPMRGNRLLVPREAGWSGYPSAKDILTTIDSQGIVEGKDLLLADLKHLLDVLVFDARLEKMGPRRRRKRPAPSIPIPTTTPAPNTDSRPAKRVKRTNASSSAAETTEDPVSPLTSTPNTTTNGKSTAQKTHKSPAIEISLDQEPENSAEPIEEEDYQDSAGETEDAEETYRWVRRSDDGPLVAVNGFSEAPCSRCPVFRLCAEGGPVDARSCGYFEEWLEI